LFLAVNPANFAPADVRVAGGDFVQRNCDRNAIARTLAHASWNRGNPDHRRVLRAVPPDEWRTARDFPLRRFAAILIDIPHRYRPQLSVANPHAGDAH
jgi:hypothetical protein